MSTGMVAAVQGPVIDVTFAHGTLPKIHEALLLEANGRKYVMEVQAHIGADTVRCIMMAGSEGIARGMEVSATGNGICVPVGECTLGRMFNVLGEPIDGEGDLPAGIETACIHRKPPAFDEQRTEIESLETVIKVIDLLESGETDTDAVQETLDEAVCGINDLQEEFDENDSEIETVARECIAATVAYILEWFGIPIDTEEAIRERDW